MALVRAGVSGYPDPNMDVQALTTQMRGRRPLHPCPSLTTGRALLAYPSPTEEPGVQGYLTLDLASCESTDPNPTDCNSTSLNPWYDPLATPPAIVYNPTNISDRICTCGTVSELYIKSITSILLYGSTAATYVADVGIVCNNGALLPPAAAIPARQLPPVRPWAHPA